MRQLSACWHRYWLPRQIHPAAWWLWALGLCVAATWTTNPLLLGLLLTVVSLVVLARRDDSPWARSFGLYAGLAAIVVGLRVGYRVLLGGGDGQTVLLRLPEIPLPEVTVGIRLLGTVTLEAVLAGLYDGLRLALLIVAVGAASALANPRRLLSALPSALYEVGTVLVIVVTVFPQLGDSLQRVRRAQRLRAQPRTGRHRLVRGIIVPVLTDALDSAVAMAASMDARGFGRTGTARPTQRRMVTGLVLSALVLLGTAAYGLLTTAPPLLGWPALLAAAACTVGAFWISGRTVTRSRYRPQRWGLAELLVSSCGALTALAVVLVARGPEAGVLNPQLLPVIEWPQLPLAVLLGAVTGLAPAVVTPRPRLSSDGGVR